MRRARPRSPWPRERGRGVTALITAPSAAPAPQSPWGSSTGSGTTMCPEIRGGQNVAPGEPKCSWGFVLAPCAAASPQGNPAPGTTLPREIVPIMVFVFVSFFIIGEAIVSPVLGDGPSWLKAGTVPRGQNAARGRSLNCPNPILALGEALGMTRAHLKAKLPPSQPVPAATCRSFVDSEEPPT